jgi:hypothetical protein
VVPAQPLYSRIASRALDECGDYGLASPLVSGSVTINGHSISIGGDLTTDIGSVHENLVYEVDGYIVRGLGNEQFVQTQFYTDGGNIISADEIMNHSGGLPTSITGPFTYNVASGDMAVGSVTFATYDSADGQDDLPYAGVDDRLTVISLCGGSPRR